MIAVHTSPLFSVSETADFILTRILARTAVPFFFMTTGYFLLPRDDAGRFLLQKFLVKTGKLYAAAILLYLPLNLYAGYFSQEQLLTELLKDLFFDGTFYHLWYFPAAALGAALVALLLKRRPINLVIAIAALLYLVGLFGDSYYGAIAGIRSIGSIYDHLFLLFDYTRNGIFFAPLYIALGVWFSRRRGRFSFKFALAGLILSLSLLMAEGLILRYYGMQRHDSIYFALIPCMIFLFQLLLSRQGTRRPALRHLAMLIYIIHPWAIVLIRGLAGLTQTRSLLIDHSIIHFAAVALLSGGAAVLLYGIVNRNKRPAFQKGRAWAEIDLAGLKHNYEQLQSVMAPGCKMMAVVKADAYGHGAPRIAAELQQAGVKAFAVASLAEGITLRENGIRGAILILGYTHPQEACRLARYRLTQTVVDLDHAVLLSRSGKNLKVHLKIDTGMRRLGEDFDHLEEIVRIFELPHLVIDGIYTHLCVADSLNEADTAFTRQQVERFYDLAGRLDSLGYRPPNLHIQSTYGLLNYPELRCGYARIGIALYGSLSNEADLTRVKMELRPVLSVKARVALVKEVAPHQTVGYGRQFTAGSTTRIATVTIGYADGIARNLCSGFVLVGGKKAPIIGRICMDQLTVDITEIPAVEQGDIVTLIGADGPEKILPEQVARQAGTIANELLSRLGARLERVYI